MASQHDASRSFRIFVTHVDGDGQFLKISGQIDKQSACMIETLIENERDKLENRVGSVAPGAILEGNVVVAKYKDGVYYRAKILSTTNLANGLLDVYFIDYGNRDVISLSTIRLLDKYHPMLTQISGQATHYYLARIINPTGKWEEQILLKLQSLLCYSENVSIVEGQTTTIPIIGIQFQGNDLSKHIVDNRYGVDVSVEKQEFLLNKLADGSLINWQPNCRLEPSFPVQTYINSPALPVQTMPAPAMPTSVRPTISRDITSYINHYIQPSSINQRLHVHRVPRTPPNFKGVIRQPHQEMPPAQSTYTVNNSTRLTSLTATKRNPTTSKNSTYKSRILEVNSCYKVIVLYAEEGPELYAVQLVSDIEKLEEMMHQINSRPHRSLQEPPMIGTVCLGHRTGDRLLCRAIVMNALGSQCRLFFVDYGDTQMVSYYDIFDIPEEFIEPNVFALRFCLSGLKNLKLSPYLNETFKQLLLGQEVTLKVVHPEGPPLIQYGELYLNNENVLNILLANTANTLQFKWMEPLPIGSKKSILVSYVDSCLKFFIQCSDEIDELDVVMEAVHVHCECTASPGELPVGAACCARFADDKNWYRACIKENKGNKVVVAFVDYGNEQEVDVSDIRTITTELVTLPAQALKCALKVSF